MTLCQADFWSRGSVLSVAKRVAEERRNREDAGKNGLGDSSSCIPSAALLLCELLCERSAGGACFAFGVFAEFGEFAGVVAGEDGEAAPGFGVEVFVVEVEAGGVAFAL